MRPQITIQDFQGRLGESANESVARFDRASEWKKSRVISITPAAEDIPVKVALTHWNLVFPPNQNCVRVAAQGMEVGKAYDNTIKAVLAHPAFTDFEFILTIEHDNTPPHDGLLKLIDAMHAHPVLSCISGLYFIKGLGGYPQIWGDPSDKELNFRPQRPDLSGNLVECQGTGMGFALWRTSMFKEMLKNEKLEGRLFETVEGTLGMATQDLSFWTKARPLGYRCAVHCGVKVGHYEKETDTVW